jgi:N-acetylglucosaminyldiphosphoundecaprenol N-acetyl-beta-D-mannosaminyltransferase
MAWSLPRNKALKPLLDKVNCFATLENAVDRVYRLRGEGFLLIAINAMKLVQIRREEFAIPAGTNTLLYPDGMYVMRLLQLDGRSTTRVAGVDLWYELLKRFNDDSGKVALVGASEEVNAAMTAKLTTEFPGITLYSRHGFNLDWEKLVTDLTAFQPDFVCFALGSPKQEQLLLKLQPHVSGALLMGVGGSFDVYAGHVQRAPLWTQKYNLEGAYRIITNPGKKRLNLAWEVTKLTGRLLAGRY